MHPTDEEQTNMSQEAEANNPPTILRPPGKAGNPGPGFDFVQKDGLEKNIPENLLDSVKLTWPLRIGGWEIVFLLGCLFSGADIIHKVSLNGDESHW